MKKRFARVVAMAAAVLVGGNVWATAFSSMYSFGDSLSDVGSSPSAVMSIYNLLGNCDPVHPCPPYFGGRVSNGPVTAEYLANTVLPGGATPANFHSFALIGATTGIGNFGDGGTATALGAFGVPGMALEIGAYMSLSGGAADPNALYFLWGGANDFLTLDDPNNAAQNIASYVQALAGMGATHILVPNLPDLGLTPYVQSLGPFGVAAGHGFSVAFNTTLSSLLDNLSALLPATDITQFDTFAFVNDVVTNPANYGFTDVQTACLSSQLVPCADPDQHLFWDGFHPTTQADAVIAAAFARSVPEPTSILLLAIGLLALAAASAQGRRVRLSA